MTMHKALQRLEEYIKYIKETLIRAASNSNGKSRTWSNEKRTTKTEKRKMGRKQLYGYFKRHITGIIHKKTWTWLKKGNLKT